MTLRRNRTAVPYREIARELGVSKTRVVQIEYDAIRKLVLGLVQIFGRDEAGFIDLKVPPKRPRTGIDRGRASKRAKERRGRAPKQST